MPYLLYAVFQIIAVLAFSVIGHVQRRKLLLFVIAWLMAGITHYSAVVLSAGANPVFTRNAVLWLIRTATLAEALLFMAAAIAFVAENVNWKKNGVKKEHTGS